MMTNDQRDRLLDNIHEVGIDACFSDNKWNYRADIKDEEFYVLLDRYQTARDELSQYIHSVEYQMSDKEKELMEKLEKLLAGLTK
jgi:hypothetical protein